MNTAVNGHWSRVEELSSKHKIDPAIYAETDQKVREAIEDIRPNEGNFITDFLISKTGEGSEKVFNNLGKSKANLERLTTSLVRDPSGFEAIRIIGELNQKYRETKPKTSQARPPAKVANGGGLKSLPKKVL